MKYCIICGAGDLPFEVAQNIVSQNNNIFLIRIDGVSNDLRLTQFENILLPVGKLGAALSAIKTRNITNLIIIGSMNVPNLSKVKPDFQGAIVLSKILAMKARGDNAILTCISDFFEKTVYKLFPL